MAARLIVSLSGLSDDSLDRGAQFAAALDARGVAISQLYRPGAFGPAVASSPLVGWMHERRDRGDAIVLHGYDHSTEPRMTELARSSWSTVRSGRDGSERQRGAGLAGRLTRVGRRAEFAALPRHEAGLRLRAARRTLGAVDLRTELFVPPRWIASAGTVDALREQGFTVLADENGVRRLDVPDMSVRAKVLGFRVSGERIPVADDARSAEAWRCRVLVAEVGRVARRGGLVRMNVRAKDLRRAPRVDAALTAIDTALSLGAQPATYRLPAATRAA